MLRIDPTAFVAPGAVVLGDVRLGVRASVWYQAVLRGDMAAISVGDESNLQDGVIVHVDEGLPCRIGSRVGVGHRALLHGCIVEDDCLIGMGAILLNRVRVGTGSVIAAGALLPEGMEVPPGSLVMGVPGQVRGPVDDALRRRIRQTVERYVVLGAAHRGGKWKSL